MSTAPRFALHDFPNSLSAICQLVPTPTPADGGMIYAETDLSRTFPEPLNALSSLLFLLLALFWIWKIRRDFARYPFLSYCLVLLLIGAIGGSVYHGFRLWAPFIMMDWLPIMILCLSASVYFLTKLVRWYIAVLILVFYVLFTFWIRSLMVNSGDIQIFINLNYSIMALLVVLPVVWYLTKERFRFGWNVLGALVAFTIAIFCRIADQWQILESGTHFLWHSFGALATACMLRYVYLVRHSEIIGPAR